MWRRCILVSNGEYVGVYFWIFQGEQTLIQQQDKNREFIVECLLQVHLAKLHEIWQQTGCNLYYIVNYICRRSTGGTCCQILPPSETEWKDRTPVSWGCSSFLLGYPNLFPAKSHFIPHKTTDTSGNKTRMVLCQCPFVIYINSIWRIYDKFTFQKPPFHPSSSL